MLATLLTLLLCPSAALHAAAHSPEALAALRAKRAATERRVDAIPHLVARTGRSLSYQHDEPDILGGTTHFSFHGTPFEHVFSLDNVPGLVSVICHDPEGDAPETLTLSVSDVRLIEPWLTLPGEDAILTGHSEAFTCVTKGLLQSFSKRVRSLARITTHTLQVDGGVVTEDRIEKNTYIGVHLDWASFDPVNTPTGAPVSATATFTTEEATVFDTFEHLKMHYFRKPGTNEREVARELQRNITRARELAAVTSTSFTYSLWSPLPWGGTGYFEYSVLNWNWNARSETPVAATQDIIPKVVFCKGCYAYIGCNINLEFSFSWWTLKTFKVTGYAGAKAAIDIQFALPPSIPRTSSTQYLAPAKGKGDAYTNPDYNFAALYTFFIFPVPFTVEIDSQLHFESIMSSTTTGQILGPGFWFEESFTLGYAYYPSSDTWGPINERKSVLNTRMPLIDIKGTAYYKGTPIFVLSFLMLSAWRVDFQLRPWLSVDAKFAAAASFTICPSASLSMTFNSGMDYKIVVFQPAFQYCMPDIVPVLWGSRCGNIPFPALGLKFPYVLADTIVSATLGTVGGAVGCQPTTSSAVAAVPVANTLPIPVTTATGAPLAGATTAAPSASTLASLTNSFTGLVGASPITSAASNLVAQATTYSSSLASSAASQLLASALPGNAAHVASAASGLLSNAMSSISDGQSPLKDVGSALTSSGFDLSSFGFWRRALALAPPGSRALQDLASLASNTTFVCGVGGCSWDQQPWSGCSVTCGAGVQTRRVLCRRGGASPGTAGAGSVVPVFFCLSPAAPTAPPASQLCERSCPGYIAPSATVGYFSSAPNAMNSTPFGPSQAIIGAKVAVDATPYTYDTTTGAQLTSPPSIYQWRTFRLAGGADSLHGYLENFEGDSDLLLSVPAMPAPKSSINWNYAADSVFLLPKDGVRPGDTVAVGLEAYAANTFYNTAIDNHGYAMYRLTLTPFNELIDGVVAFDTALDGTHVPLTITPSVSTLAEGVYLRYFRFLPSSTALTFNVEVVETNGQHVEILANRWAQNGWPTPSNASWNSNGFGDPSLSARHFSPAASDFSYEVYSIAVACYAPNNQCSFKIRATNLELLPSGSTVTRDLALGGVVNYVLYAGDTDTQVLFVLTGDTLNSNLFVSRAPFTASPSSDCSSPGVVWCSLSAGFVVSPVYITHLDPQGGGGAYYIAVASPKYADTFSLASQSYESVDPAPTLRRLQQPGTMTYFLGSPSVGGSEEVDLAFHAHLALTPTTSGSVDMHAGSVSRFYPAVQLGFEGVSSPPLVPGGPAGRIDSPYLEGDYISRQMILGVHSPIFWAPSQPQNGRQASTFSATVAGGGLNIIAPLLSGAGHGLPDIASAWSSVRSSSSSSNSSAAAELAAAARAHLAVQPRGSPTHAVQMDSHAALRTEIGKGLVWDSEGSTPEQRRRRLAEQPEAALPPPATALPLFDAAAHIDRFVAAARVRAEAAEATLAATASAAARARRAQGILSAMTDPSNALQPAAPMQVPLERFSNFAWVAMATCSAGGFATASASCATLTTPSAGVPVFLRLRIQARSALQLSIVASNTPSDAVYSVAYALNSLPAATLPENDALGQVASGSAVTVTQANCAYTASHLYLAVTGGNSDGSGSRFSAYLAGSSTSGLVCSEYKWVTTPWNACSVNCGVGHRSRTVVCVDTYGVPADSALCPPTTQPNATQVCDNGACAWSSGEWNACSAPCGDGRAPAGTQRRINTCRNGGGSGYEVLPYQCAPPIPAAVQGCSSEACPANFFYAKTWSGCSKACGGGYRTRSVQCVKLVTASPFTSLPQADFVCLGPGVVKPASWEECNVFPCPLAAYDLAMFDRRTLQNGIPRTDTLAKGGGTALYLFQRPSAAVQGVCIQVDSRAPTTQPPCTKADERKIAVCMSMLGACHQNATAAASASAPGTVYVPLTKVSRSRVGAPTLVPSATCGCFAAAKACLEGAYCPVPSSSLAPTPVSSLAALAQLCSATTCRADPSAVCAGIRDVAPPLPKEGGNLAVYAAPLVNIGIPSLQPLEATYSNAQARWTTTTLDAATRRMYLLVYGPSYSSAADSMEIGVVAANASATATIQVTALTSPPVTASGTLLSSAATAARVQAGGLTLTLTLQCDLFKAPSAGTSNLLAAGIISTTTSVSGWNRIVRPLLQDAATPAFVVFGAGNTQATITLPAVPAYNPPSSETLLLAIPGSMMNSGKDLSVPVTATLAASSSDCAVGSWGTWSPCSASCAVGVQTRSRQVLVQASGSGAACPPTTVTRPCNDCNACSTVACAYGALCAAGACLCPPGYTGVDCSIPPSIATSFVWRVGPWSPCSAQCGSAGNTQTRQATCFAYSAGAYTPAASPLLCSADPAAPPPPTTLRACNPQLCSESRLDLTLALPISYGTLVLSSAVTDAFNSALAMELASACGVNLARVAVLGVFPALVSGNGTTVLPANVASPLAAALSPSPARLTLSSRTLQAAPAAPVAPGSTIAVQVSILPPSAIPATTNGTVQMVGAPNADALAILTSGAGTAGSGVNTRGTLLPLTNWGASSYAVVSGPRADVAQSAAILPPAAASALPLASSATPSAAPLSVSATPVVDAAGSLAASGAIVPPIDTPVNISILTLLGLLVLIVGAFALRFLYRKRLPAKLLSSKAGAQEQPPAADAATLTESTALSVRNPLTSSARALSVTQRDPLALPSSQVRRWCKGLLMQRCKARSKTHAYHPPPPPFTHLLPHTLPIPFLAAAPLSLQQKLFPRARLRGAGPPHGLDSPL
jgi:hypothetical protein